MTKGTTPGEIAAAWWRENLDSDTGAARKTRAELRRADTPLEALNVAAVHDLHRRLAEAEFNLRKVRDGPDKLALISSVLAHVRKSQKVSLAQLFGVGNPPLLSRIRFDALIRADAPRDLGRQLVRALRNVKDGANVRRLANDLYWWNDRVRTDWCFEYHGANIAKPGFKIKDNST